MAKTILLRKNNKQNVEYYNSVPMMYFDKHCLRINCV